MENLVRNIPPKFKTDDSIDILASEVTYLSNRIPVHVINGGSQDVIKIEFIFNAGIWSQDAPLIAEMTNTMLNEGTKRYNAAEIAEKFDFYGAHIEFSTEKHEAGVSLYTLNKYLRETLEVTEDIIKNSKFPEKEFKTILLNKKQKYQIDHQKTIVLAKEKFSQMAYGKGHPYSGGFSADEFEKLKFEEIKAFYRRFYVPNNCHIIIAGKVSRNVLSLIENLFGSARWPLKKEIIKKKHKLDQSLEREAFVCKDDAVQASIMIGRPIFTKPHEDYNAMQLLNTILGGYFGSRLMQNIREDKGYTYGIGSTMLSYAKAGQFTIMAEVGVTVCEDTIKEIYKEIRKLREELVAEKEMQLVKTYIYGEMLRSLDNPFALSESLKGNLPFGFDNSYYQKYINELKTISAAKVKELAVRYLQEEDLYLVVCGPEDCSHLVQ